MTHKPIQIKNLGLYFSHKTCFENFSAKICHSDRIAIIGNNGSGKSTLLKILAKNFEPTSGHINIPENITWGYVPQVINKFEQLSGGQRFNKSLTQALSTNPNILLLDEPTNHLDISNRKKLLRLLQNYSGTLVMVSHDMELLKNHANILWHIDNNKIRVFSGNYCDYISDMKIKKIGIEKEIIKLKHQKKDLHNKLMREQQKNAKSKNSGKKKVKNRRWLKMVGDLKEMKAEKSQGKKLKSIDDTKQKLNQQLDELYLPEAINYKFSIDSCSIKNCALVQISNGSIGYIPNQQVLSNVNLMISNNDRIAICGNNGSGKSTLVKAIMGDKTIYKKGNWFTPNRSNIGYLDQHYSTLNPNQSALEIISNLMPNWSHIQIRKHLNDFLFRKNEEVNTPVAFFSGGEKARLSLAQIAVKNPKLLILDEITNNLDLETKSHVIQVLKNYPGALLVISHDPDFLEEIEVKDFYEI